MASHWEIPRGKRFTAELKQATTAAFHGHSQFFNPAMPLVIEYMERKRLSELGFTYQTKVESPFVVECLLIIDREVCRLKDEKEKRDALKAGRT